jgi:mono/diheme cytochrome c family protein
MVRRAIFNGAGGDHPAAPDDPRNLLVAMLDGIGPENFPHRTSLQAMPGFADKLSDRQAAGLANQLRAIWDGRKPDVTAAAVRALR